MRTSKLKVHMIEAEATNVTTKCGKASDGGGINVHSDGSIRSFSEDGTEFRATTRATYVSCANCRRRMR
jgi:hypothetical protein